MYRIFAAGGMALLAALALQPAEARAGTHVGVGIGLGLGGGYYPSPYQRGYPIYDPDDDYGDDADYISCGEGRRIVRDYGFYRVRPTRCGGSVYRYEAVKRDRLWSVKVSARSGRIISAYVVDDDY
jgi:hypothetical protein